MPRGGRPQTNDKPTKYLSFNVSQKEKKMIQVLAQGEGLTTAEFIRQCLFHYIESEYEHEGWQKEFENFSEADYLYAISDLGAKSVSKFLEREAAEEE